MYSTTWSARCADKSDDMVLEEGAGQGAGTRLNRLREQAGISSATILRRAGRVLATATDSGRTLRSRPAGRPSSARPARAATSIQ